MSPLCEDAFNFGPSSERTEGCGTPRPSFQGLPEKNASPTNETLLRRTRAAEAAGLGGNPEVAPSRCASRCAVRINLTRASTSRRRGGEGGGEGNPVATDPLPRPVGAAAQLCNESAANPMILSQRGAPSQTAGHRQITTRPDRSLDQGKWPFSVEAPINRMA